MHGHRLGNSTGPTPHCSPYSVFAVDVSTSVLVLSRGKCREKAVSSQILAGEVNRGGRGVRGEKGKGGAMEPGYLLVSEIAQA